VEPQGLGKESRARLGRLLRTDSPVLTPELTARQLSLSRAHAAHELARWARAGWLARIRRGAYVAVPLEAPSAEVALEDPWVVATQLFAPCYIGGWSAAEHWGLTEQIFRTVCVMTASHPRKRTAMMRGTRFSIHSVAERKLFGLKVVWRGRTRVQLSDPARTLIDTLSDPGLGGGIRTVADILSVFLREHRTMSPKLIEYGTILNNAAIFKRLGFLLSTSHPEEQELIRACRARLSAGYAKLDPRLSADRLITGWRLWVPGSWKGTRARD
jgi:predicted transcriptional regulator of viral defense system